MLRKLILTLLLVPLIVFVAFVAALRPADDALYPGDDRIVGVVDHGWHAALILKTSDLAAAALAEPDAEGAGALWSLSQFSLGADWIEVGWGDDGFYRAQAASVTEMPLGVTLSALFMATPSVLHVFPGVGPPGEAFPASDYLEMSLSDAGFRLLAQAIGRSANFADGSLVDQGPGLYGAARFFKANGAYSALMTCNHWVAAMLGEAGAPASWVASATSSGLMAELRWRK